MSNEPAVMVDEKWRAFSAAGNEAFARGDDRTARALYSLALDESAHALAMARSGDATAIPMAPVLQTIAFHNMAALARRSGNAAESLALLQRAVESLVSLARDSSAPASLRVHAADNLKPAIAELVEHGAVSRDALAPLMARAMEAWLCARELQQAGRPISDRPCVLM